MKKTVLLFAWLLFALLSVVLLMPGTAASAHPPEQRPLPHVLQGREDCASCHARGLAGAPKYPSDHEGRTSSTCLVCHPVVPPLISHTLDGRADCVSCHAQGVSGAPKYPLDHQGRPSSICLGCHMQGQPLSAAPTPTANSNPAAPATPPAIPHPLDGRDNCLQCHAKGIGGAPVLPSSHAGRTVDTCRKCHQPVQPGAPGGPPFIPHQLAGRDNCLACHAQGLGGAPVLPASHAGRTVFICRSCHQPAPSADDQAPLVMPTAIPHPQAAANQNTCATCHAALGSKSAQDVQDWQGSIHAQRGVTCVDCHGGDPTRMNKDESMSPAAGYRGVPKIFDIPALCASCHSRVDAMRQYDLPVDQWTKYQQSIHGQKLAQGDTNVATCFTCHDGHGTKQVSDPSSEVYPSNVPALCASCHANSDLMKPYGIPTDQYTLYQKSVHGIALLDNQDLRAPSCATCHGTHGAAPPGLQEVSNVCGSCHTATQDYYLKSKHAGNAPGTPQCVTCHGRYDVMPPTEAIFEGTGPRQCGSCHAVGSPEAEAVQSLLKSIGDSAAAVSEAETAINRAASAALIVAPEQAKLAEAKTNLIAARAAQHSLSLDVVKERTDKTTALAKEVSADAEKSIADSLFRREVMGIDLGIMALAIGSLYIIRRELYNQLPKE